MMIVSPVFSGEPNKKLHEKCIYPTVMIVSADNSSTSTGVVIRSEKIKDEKYHNIVITTSHGISIPQVVVNIPNYVNWSEIAGTMAYPGMTYYINRNIDLAIIVFMSRKRIATADLGLEEKVFIGNKIIRVGCGLGDAPRLEEGILTGINTKSHGRAGNRVHRMSIFTLPGDSGGPVFNEDYKLIGWTQSIRSIRTNPFIEETFYNYAMAIRVKDLGLMAKAEEGGLDFSIDKTEPLPVLEFFKLKTEFLGRNQRPIPAHPWIDN